MKKFVITIQKLGVPIIVVSMIVFICACAAQQQYWTKPNFTQQEWSTDKYECMQQSQHETSYATGGWCDAYGNCYPGRASSGTSTNTPLFKACMEARGYVLTTQEQIQIQKQAHQEESQMGNCYDKCKEYSTKNKTDINKCLKAICK